MLLGAEARDGVGGDIARDKRPRVERTAQLLGQHHQVDQGLLGDAATLVGRRHEHGRPAELGASAPEPGVEGIGRLHRAAHVGARLVLGEEPPRRLPQQALFIPESEIHA